MKTIFYSITKRYLVGVEAVSQVDVPWLNLNHESLVAVEPHHNYEALSTNTTFKKEEFHHMQHKILHKMFLIIFDHTYMPVSRFWGAAKHTQIEARTLEGESHCCKFSANRIFRTSAGCRITPKASRS